MKNVLTIDGRGAGVDPRAELENGAARLSRPPTATTSERGGEERSRRPVVARRRDHQGLSKDPADRVRHRRRCVVGAYAPKLMTTMSIGRRVSMRPARWPRSRDVVAVTEAGQDPGVVDRCIGAELADDPADERPVAGLAVEAAVVVVVRFVLVVRRPGVGRSCQSPCTTEQSCSARARVDPPVSPPCAVRCPARARSGGSGCGGSRLFALPCRIAWSTSGRRAGR